MYIAICNNKCNILASSMCHYLETFTHVFVENLFKNKYQSVIAKLFFCVFVFRKPLTWSPRQLKKIKTKTTRKLCGFMNME